MSQHALGIDIGGTGIKGAVIDLESGELVSERLKLPTPKNGSPKAILKTVNQLIANLDVDASSMPVGITCPAVVVNGHTRTAANISHDWIGFDAESMFSEELGTRVALLNDADAAGYSEVSHGAAKDVSGLVIVTTLGTGIGSAFMHDGRLIPNVEIGHIDIGRHPNFERFASNTARVREHLNMRIWSKRLQMYYKTLEDLFWPDLFVVGGGVSKKHEEFLPNLQLRTKIVPARHRNNAGLIGAASYAAQKIAK